MKRTWVTYLLLAIALSGLLGGLAWIINTRFETGKAYAVRSSLRTDPLGGKALYEAYLALPELTVERNFVPLDQMQSIDPESTLLILNAHGWGVHGLAEFDVINRFIKQGGRLVIAMEPSNVSYKYIRGDSDELQDSTEEGSDSDSVEEEDAETEKDDVETVREDSFPAPTEDDENEWTPFTRKPSPELELLWAGLAFQYGEHEGGDAMLVGEASAKLPDVLPWREGGILVDYDEDEWIPVYKIGEEVVVAERSYGRGSVVVMTDDYLFSNEAMLKHRFPELLVWVLGEHQRVIFEETHLGVSERTGIAVLIHRYRLSGFAIAFILFMLLVVWRGTFPLLPAFKSATSHNVVKTEHSSEAGLGDLVRRALPLSQLPRLAFAQWKSTFIRGEMDRKHYEAQLAEIEALLAEKSTKGRLSQNPAETHLKIKSIINRKRRSRL